MMNLYPGVGMGAAGTGVGPMGSAQTATMSPQAMMMLRMMQAGMGNNQGSPATQGSAAGMPQATMPGVAGPMSQFIGQGQPMPQGQGAGNAPMLQPQQPLNSPQAPTNPMQSMGSQLQAYQQLQALAKGQTGVPPTSGPATAAGAAAANGNPNALAGAAGSSWLQQLLAHYGGMGGAGMMGSGMGPGAAG